MVRHINIVVNERGETTIKVGKKKLDIGKPASIIRGILPGSNNKAICSLGIAYNGFEAPKKVKENLNTLSEVIGRPLESPSITGLRGVYHINIPEPYKLSID